MLKPLVRPLQPVRDGAINTSSDRPERSSVRSFGSSHTAREIEEVPTLACIESVGSVDVGVGVWRSERQSD